MKVWAKQDFTYWDADSRVWRRIPAGTATEMRGDIVAALFKAHPGKLSPFAPNEVRTVVMSGPPAHRQMRPN